MRRSFVWIIAAILLAAGVFACVCGTPLSYDGSFQLCITLRNGSPFVYMSRFHSWPLWWPVAWLSRITENLTVLQTAFGLPFLLAPIASILLSWWIVRRQAPWLILWPILSLAAALPGQIFIMNESIFQLYLFWPVFLGLLLPITWRQAIVLALLAIFQLSHPIGMMMLAGGAVAAMLMAAVDRPRRTRLLIGGLAAAALALAAIIKLAIWPDPYAQSEANLISAADRWMKGVAGWPVRGVLLMWIVALLTWIASDKATRAFRITAMTMAFASAVFAAAMWSYWATDEHLWGKAVNYRRWVVPLAMPFFAFAFLEADPSLRNRDDSPPRPIEIPRIAMGLLIATIFATVLSLQSFGWLKMTSALEAQINAHAAPVIDPAELSWTRGTALSHWAITTHLMYLQGKRPCRMLLDEKALQAVLGNPPLIPYAEWDLKPPEPGPWGWFDLREFTAEARRTQRDNSEKNSAPLRLCGE